ncbi:hypothetical protein BGX24_004078 [Mortierella sp. AD032]|nr:hypothetical protein BGX24_004078 [Mortierella sp. AD032]
MSNPMFDDFIELDLLDASDPANAMFASFYLGDTADIHDDNDINNLAPVIDNTATSTSMTDTPADTDDAAILGLVIKTEPSDSPMLLNSIPLSPQQTLASDESPLIFDTDMALITPDQLTIAPQATTVSPSSLSNSSTTAVATMATVSTAAATASSASAQSAVAIDSSKTLKSTAATPSSSAATNTQPSSSTSTSSQVSPAPAASTSTAKRASPEPATSPARKHAKTDSISSSKAKSSSASKKSSSSAPTTSNAAAATKASSSAAKSTASSSAAASSTSTTSTSTSASSSSATNKGKTQTPDPTAEFLTSTANTTLSAATLQFLLQQQVETPLIPQLFTGKLTREEIEETLARLLESTKYLIPTPDDETTVKIKEEPVSDEDSDNEMEGIEPTSTMDGAEPSHGLKTQPGIKTDDIPSSTDLKKMTSKERRQLRNKISARNFRVRRKEYIYTLEGQVLQHKTEARHLREAVTLMQDENQRLKDELESVRRQLETTTLAPTTIINTATFASTSADPMLSPEPSMPLSRENQSLLTSIMNRNAAMNPNAKSNITLTMARPQSPILTPNLHKDVPNSSSGSASQSSWKDKNPIMVHRTLIPEICFGDEFQFDSKPSSTLDTSEMYRPWMTFDPKPAKPQLTVSDLVFEFMQTFTCMSASMSPSMAESTTEEESFAETDPEAALDWELQQNLWALTQVEEEDEMAEEQIQLVYDLIQCQASTTTSRPSSPMQEDPNMLEWLYESMMARLVDLDLQDSQHSTLAESHMA